MSTERKILSNDLIEFLESQAFKQAVSEQIRGSHIPVWRQFLNLKIVAGAITALFAVLGLFSFFDFSDVIRKRANVFLFSDDFLMQKIPEISRTVFSARDVVGDDFVLSNNKDCMEGLMKNNEEHLFLRCTRFKYKDNSARLPISVFPGQYVFIDLLIHQLRIYVHPTELCAPGEEMHVINGKKIMNPVSTNHSANQKNSPCLVHELPSEPDMRAFSIKLNGKPIKLVKTGNIKKLKVEGDYKDYQLLIGRMKYEVADGASVDRDVSFLEISPGKLPNAAIISTYRLVAHVTYTDRLVSSYKR